MSATSKMEQAIAAARLRYDAGMSIAWAIREGLEAAGIQQDYAGGAREFFGSPEYIAVRQALLGETL